MRRRKLQSIGQYSSVVADDLRGAESNSNLHAEYDETIEGLFGRSGWKKIVEDLTADQETLRLHFFEEYTFAEIADELYLSDTAGSSIVSAMTEPNEEHLEGSKAGDQSSHSGFWVTGQILRRVGSGKMKGNRHRGRASGKSPARRPIKASLRLPA